MVALADKTNTRSNAAAVAKAKAAAALAAPVKHKEVSSFKVFMEFVEYKNGKVNAAGILSSDCYQKWIMSRRKHPLKPQEAFRRALTAHCRGVDGRRPFPEKVEASLLVELRKKQRWKCFENYNDGCGKIGIQGFPSLGYHERKMKDKKRSFLEAQAAEEVKRARYNSSFTGYANTYASNKLEPLRSFKFDSPAPTPTPMVENDSALFNQSWSNNLDLFDAKVNNACASYFKTGKSTQEPSAEIKYEFDRIIEEVIDPGLTKQQDYGYFDTIPTLPSLPNFTKTCSYEESRLDEGPELSHLIEQFLL